MFHDNNSIYSTAHFDEPPVQAYEHTENGYHNHESYQETNNPRYSGAFSEFYSLKCHGTKAAIELKPSITRKSQWETVMLEAANATGPKQFNWSDKTSIQITKNELPHVIGMRLAKYT